VSGIRSLACVLIDVLPIDRFSDVRVLFGYTHDDLLTNSVGPLKIDFNGHEGLVTQQ
jgi:hypothetical protein